MPWARVDCSGSSAAARPAASRAIASHARCAAAIPERSCLACRYLMTSSGERTDAGWCELPAVAPDVPLAPRRRSNRSPRRSPSSLRLLRASNRHRLDACRSYRPLRRLPSSAPGQQLFVHGGAATPSVLLQRARANAPIELEDVRVLHFHTEGPAPHLAPEMAGHFRHKALFIGANARAAVNEGRAEYIPVFLSDVPGLFRSGILPLDAVLINVTPPDAHGFCSLGTSVDATLAAVRSSKLVIAQLNDRMPRTLGDTFVHVSKIDYATEVSADPYEYDEGS